MLNPESVDVEEDNLSILFTDEDCNESLIIKLTKKDARSMATMIMGKTKWKK